MQKAEEGAKEREEELRAVAKTREDCLLIQWSYVLYIYMYVYIYIHNIYIYIYIRMYIYIYISYEV